MRGQPQIQFISALFKLNPSFFLPKHDIQQTKHYKTKNGLQNTFFPIVCKQFSRCLNRNKPFLKFKLNESLYK